MIPCSQTDQSPETPSAIPQVYAQATNKNLHGDDPRSPRAIPNQTEPACGLRRAAWFDDRSLGFNYALD